MGASVGIRPKADGENIVLTDTHRDLVDDVTATTDEFGTVLGEGINEISATAKSANDSAGELAARVKVLEARSGLSAGVFQVWEGRLTPINGVKWAYWGLGRIYPPAGTYWVDATAGVTVEKRGNVTESLSFPAVVSFQEGEYLLLFNKQDGQAVRVTPI